MRIFAVGQLGWSTLSGIISAWFVTFYLPTQNDIAGGAIQYIMPGLIIGGFLTVARTNAADVFLLCSTRRFRFRS